MPVMGLFSKIAPPPRFVQANPVTAQNTPWLEHLRLLLGGNVGWGRFEVT
jgi:hypothetical protein